MTSAPRAWPASALMLLSIFMFSFGDALGKFLVGDLFGRAAAVAARLRGAAGAVAADLAAAHQFLQLERPWLQLLRVVLSTLEVAAFFLATVYLPLADVITYYLAVPDLRHRDVGDLAAREGRLAALERRS